MGNVENIMTHPSSITTPFFTVVAIIAVIVSGFLIGRPGTSIRIVENPLSLYANIETVGVVVSGAGLATTGQLLYRRSGETAWQAGHPLTRIDDGRLVGSLFGLS